MRFEVKIDYWIKLILWLCVIGVFPAFFFVPEDEMFIIFITIVLMALLILPLMYYSYYELREDHLYIRMSVIGMKIKYADITGIRSGKYSKTNNMAFSLDAVIIERSKKTLGEISVSPLEKEVFMLELKRRCPLLNDFGVFE
jgi:hypothetical protein